VKGDGYLYQRGKIWWIGYSIDGQNRQVSAKTGDKEVAQKFLRAKLGNAVQGIELVNKADRVTLRDLIDALEADYSAKGNRSARMLTRFEHHSVAFFGEKTRLSKITKTRIQQYVENRRTQLIKHGDEMRPPSVATINGELRLLKHAFNLLVADNRLDKAPQIVISASKEKVRRGFVDPPEFAKLVEALPAYLKDPITFLYRSGWRRNEVATLEWSDVNLKDRRVTLRPELSKNGESRPLKLDDELLSMLTRLSAKRDESRAFVFIRNDKYPLGGFRKAWVAACSVAGLNGILVHDLRRSAARNMIRAGISERVAMLMTGHKTRSMFDRYAIVDETDLDAGVSKLSKYMNEAQKKQKRKIYPMRKAS